MPRDMTGAEVCSTETPVVFPPLPLVPLPLDIDPVGTSPTSAGHFEVSLN